MLVAGAARAGGGAVGMDLAAVSVGAVLRVEAASEAGPSEEAWFAHGPRSATVQRKSHLCIPFLEIARPQSQFLNSCVCEQFI